MVGTEDEQLKSLTAISDELGAFIKAANERVSFAQNVEEIIRFRLEECRALIEILGKHERALRFMLGEKLESVAHDSGVITLQGVGGYQ